MDLVGELRGAGVTRGGQIALVVTDGRATLATRAQSWTATTADVVAVEEQLRPRWIWWSGDTPAALVAAGIRVATCWDLAAVHRLLFGGWAAEPDRIWAALRELPESARPALGQLTLGGESDADDEGDPEQPVRPDGYLRPEWTGGGWARTSDRRVAWAKLAVAVAGQQVLRLRALPTGGDAVATAYSESAAELLCTELAADGLPVDRDRAEQLIASFVGPRPSDEREALRIRGRRDDEVLRHAPPGIDPTATDLRNPASVRALLARCGIDVPDTRSWRLEPFVGAHPVVEALLTWRRAERIATTFGYRWLDERVGPAPGCAVRGRAVTARPGG